MNWGTRLFTVITGACSLMVQGDAAVKLASRPGKVSFSCGSTRPPDDSGPEGYDFINDGLGTVLNNEMVIIEQGYDRVGCFLNAYDVVGIEEKLLFVHAS